MLQKNLEFYGIIPARYASSRFPGKPLAKIQGYPMFWHVYSQAVQASIFTSVVLATDNEEICSAAEQYSVPYIMTSTTHETGTERVYEAAVKLGIPEHAVVVNIQGDEPLIEPSSLCRLVEPFSDISVLVTTLAIDITEERAQSPHQVKVVIASNGDALYFSRSLIPSLRDSKGVDSQNIYMGHIGLYAFRMDALKKFVSFPPSRLELFEKLEQLRLLENNIPIRVVYTTKNSLGVDTLEDLIVVQKILAQKG